MSASMQISLSKPCVGAEEIAAATAVLSSGNLAQGVEVGHFEAEFASLIGVEHAVAVNSGTSALHVMLLGSGIGEGDHVIVPSFTFAATANAVALTGATPIFADIDPSTYCITPESVVKVATPETKAVLPVHLYGQPCDMAGFAALCESESWLLFEDASQAHLASVGGKRVGSWGHGAAFSFYPTKNMTTGEGGMVTTNSARLARNMRLLRNQGMESRYQNEIVGMNLRMTDVAGAIGRIQLTRLPQWTAMRQENASFLTSRLEAEQGLSLPTRKSGIDHAFHQFTIGVNPRIRGALLDYLGSCGVQTGIYYPTPCHRLPSFQKGAGVLPETDLAARSVLSLPVHPFLETEDLTRVADAVLTFCAGV